MENRFDLIWFIVLNATINGQKKKDKRTNNDLQSTTQIIKDWAARTPLKTGMNSGAPEGWAVLAPMWHPSCYSCYKLVISHAWWKERIVIIKKHEHIRGHLWHRYSSTVNQVMDRKAVRTKWWRQLNH